MFRFFISLIIVLVFSNVSFAADKKLNIVVSIPPQKYLLDRIGADKVEVTVMVKPGQSPETYDPTPKQLVMVSKANIYFRIDIPFEEHWMDVIVSQNNSILIVDACAALSKSNSGCGSGIHDPHVWTNPNNIKLIAKQIESALIQEDPGSASYYQSNSRLLMEDLEKLDTDIRFMLKERKTDYFVVSHDSLSYYADHYGLKQLALESAGRQRGPRGLAELVTIAKQRGIDTLFIQRQHPTGIAYTLAEELNAKVVMIDPLAENYIDNLRHISGLIAEATR